jgi:hypothetical protein
MTRIANGILIIEPEPEGNCELCGKKAELRPYGANGENICYECGEKDPETTERRMHEVYFSKMRPQNPDLN